MLPQWIYLAQIFTVVWLIAVTKAQNGLATGDTGVDGLCNSALGHYPPLATGKCPEGTAWLEQYECCVECVYCPPGTRKSGGGCHSVCVQCENGTYSAGPYNQEDSCLPCTACRSLHRQELQACVRQRDALCGSCLSGYYPDDDQDTSGNSPSPCQICTKSDQHKNCERIITSSDTVIGEQRSEGGDQQGDSSPTPIIIAVIAVLLVLIIIAAVAVLLVVRKRKRKQTKNSIVVDEEHPLHTDEVDSSPTTTPLTSTNGQVKSEDKNEERKPEIVTVDTPDLLIRHTTRPIRTKDYSSEENLSPKEQQTPTRRVKFEGDPLLVGKNKRNGGDKAQSSDEEEYLAGDHSPDEFKSALMFPIGQGLDDKAKQSSFQSIDDDESAAAAWGYYTGSNKDKHGKQSQNSKQNPDKKRLQESGTQEFSSLPQSY